MKRILFLLLGLVVYACTSYDDTPEPETPTPVTFGDWQPAFSNQTESFTQTRTGSDGSSQSRTITVSTTLTNLTDIYEMEDNDDINDDGDFFDIAQSRTITYNTSPDVGSFSNSSVDIVHDNNGTNYILIDGTTYPINLVQLGYDNYGAEIIEFGLSFFFINPNHRYKPSFINESFFGISALTDDLPFGKYLIRYDEDSTIPSEYGYEQSTDDKYITYAFDTVIDNFRAEYYPETPPSSEFYIKVNTEMNICEGVPVGYDAEVCNTTSALSAVMYYKEFNGNSFFSIRGYDLEQRPYEVFFFGNIRITYDDDSFFIDGAEIPRYQFQAPYTSTEFWDPDSPRETSGLNNNNGAYFPDDNFPDVQIGTIYQVLTQSLKVVDKSTGPIPDSWREYFNQAYGYSPENLNLVRLKLLNLEGENDPVVQAFYKDNAELIFLRIGTNDFNASEGFHMNPDEYDYTELVNQEFRECNGDDCYFNDVNKTLNFYLDRYLRDLRNDAILTF